MQSKPSFFLIDDSKIDLFITKKFLQRHRVSDAIRLFENPKEALAAIESKENLPDIILLDIKMPELDGFEFVDKIAKVFASSPHDFKVIMLSSTLDFRDEERAQSHPIVFKLLEKPLNMEDLQVILHQLGW
jgi:CheY-like chemotaxis protein